MAPPQALAALATRYWDAHLQAHPLQATEIGDRRFDDRLPDNTPAARDREMAALAALRARVEAVPAAALSAGRSRDARRCCSARSTRELAFGSCALDDWAVDARDGTAGGVHAPARAAAGAHARRRLEAGGALEKMGAVHRSGDGQPAARAGGGQGRDRRRDPTRAGPAGRSAGQARRQVAAARARRARRTPTGRPPERLAFTRADRRGDRRRHPPGVRAPPRRCCAPRSCRAPATRRTPASSTCRAAPPATRKLIKVHTSLELPAAEIHRIGLEELARIHAEMARIGQGGVRHAARCPSCGGGCAAIRRRFFRARGEVETAARKALARAQAAEPRFLGQLPRTPCVVKRIDEFEEKDAPIAYYRPAAIDGTPPGHLLRQHLQAGDARPLRGRGAGVSRIGSRAPHPDRDRAGADRAARVPQARGRHRVRRRLGPVRRGAGRRAGPVQGRARAAGPAELRRVARAAGWSSTPASTRWAGAASRRSRSSRRTRSSPRTTSSTRSIATSRGRARRWPTSWASARSARCAADAETRLGPKFDVKAFHDLLLGGGAVSLPVLREQIEEWIAAARAAR